MPILADGDQALGAWVLLFSTSHIGMSAARSSLIDVCGRGANQLGIVGRDLKLPEIWLADESGLDVFPDVDTAGRQIYRVCYSAISFLTLGSAFSSYLSCRDVSPLIEPFASLGSTESSRAFLFALAAVAQGISLASLGNPSPLSLVPGFSGDSDSALGVQRDDSLKLNPYGLTRITRHPLILPVVPWGLANAALTGGRAADALLFVGLAAYALAGCAAQDLRASQAGEVGTAFGGSGERLRGFYASTSFLPFAALFDGRQPAVALASELPTGLLAAGCIAGCAIEAATLHWFGV